MMAAVERSAATAHAVAFVDAHVESAETLGTDLAELVNDPDAFARRLDAGLRDLADPAYEAGQHGVAPGLGPVHGVRWPLLAAVSRSFRRGTRHDPPTPLLFLADRLLREPMLEPHWFAFGILERTLVGEPERTWQLMRRAARGAGDWITVDSLARAYAAGVLAESYRWAELEQLVYSTSRWERRLVGSTIATMTHGSRGRRYAPAIVERSLPILDQLMGDDEPDVQKALAWAYRSLAALDRGEVTAALGAHADLAVAAEDGHRAWVIRDTLAKLDPADAAALRTRLTGIRRRRDATATSPAAAVAAAFGPMPDPIAMPEPPL